MISLVASRHQCEAASLHIDFRATILVPICGLKLRRDREVNFDTFLGEQTAKHALRLPFSAADNIRPTANGRKKAARQTVN